MKCSSPRRLSSRRPVLVCLARRDARRERTGDERPHAERGPHQPPSARCALRRPVGGGRRAGTIRLDPFAGGGIVRSKASRGRDGPHRVRSARRGTLRGHRRGGVPGRDRRRSLRRRGETHLRTGRGRRLRRAGRRSADRRPHRRPRRPARGRRGRPPHRDGSRGPSRRRSMRAESSASRRFWRT